MIRILKRPGMIVIGWNSPLRGGEQMANIRFVFQPEKFVNAVAYLAQACPGSTKMTICKQLYYADKEHLVRFGRPINRRPHQSR